MKIRIEISEQSVDIENFTLVNENGTKQYYKQGEISKREYSKHNNDTYLRFDDTSYKVEVKISAQYIIIEDFILLDSSGSLNIIKYYKQGKLHRDDAPAVEFGTTKIWYKNGKLHRENGPAVEGNHYIKEWRLNNMLQENGPAVEFTNWYKKWYINGKLHRENGPAIEYENGTKQYYKQGELHREDGPAIDCASGYKEWWINGKQFTEKEFEIVKISKIAEMIK